MLDISVEILKRAAAAASRSAKKENKKMGLSEVTLIGNQVVRIEENGEVTVLETLPMIPVRVINRKMKIGNKKNS